MDSYLTTLVPDSTINYNGDEYPIVSGYIDSPTGTCTLPIQTCALSNFQIENILASKLNITINDAYGINTLTIDCAPNTSINVCSCSAPVLSAPVPYSLGIYSC